MHSFNFRLNPIIGKFKEAREFLVDAIRNITLEPCVLLLTFSFGLYSIVSKNLYVMKTCRVNLNYTKEICDNLTEHETIQVEVQKYTSEIMVYSQVLQVRVEYGI